MPNVLEVQIVGDLSDLQKKFVEAKKLQADYTASIEKTSSELKESISVTNGYKKAIDDLNSAYKNGSVSSKDYSKQLANLKRDEKESTVATADLRKELANLKREQKDLGGSFDTAGKKVANGGNALMQFSRIAQDAPYGIIGIGNNITATVEAFGHLQKSTGSTGGALKALAGSIVGSGGILLAVSLLTTALTYMSQNGITVSDVVAKLSGNFNKARKSAQDLNVEAVKGSKEQISTMNAYVATAANVNLSMSDRLIAVKKLQDEYPAYFGNLTKEQILNGNVANAVAGVTKALIAKAKAAALVDKIVKLSEEEAKAQNEVNNIVAKSAKIYSLTAKEAFDLSKLINEQVRLGKSNTDQLLSLGDSLGYNTVQMAALATAANDINGLFTDLGGNLAKNRKEQDDLTESLNKTTGAYIKLDKEKDPKGKKKLERSADIIPFKTALQPVLDVEKTTSALLEVRNEYGKLQEKIVNFSEIPPVKISPVTLVTDQFIKDLTKLEGLMADYKAITGETLTLPAVITTDYVNSLENALKTTKLFANGAGAAMGALGSQLASELATGNAALDAFVGSVIQGLAQVAAAQLTGLIAKQAVATTSLATDAAVSTGNAITAATSTAAATGPAAAFVLPALVGAAIGFIAASFAGIKFAHGGIVPGGSFTGDKIPAMLNSGEAVMNQQQQANTLMAIANGNSNSLQGNRKSSTFVLETKLRGADLLLAIKREEKSR